MMEKGVAIDSYIAHIVLVIVYIINYTQLMRRDRKPILNATSNKLIIKLVIKHRRHISHRRLKPQQLTLIDSMSEHLSQ